VDPLCLERLSVALIIIIINYYSFKGPDEVHMRQIAKHELRRAAELRTLHGKQKDIAGNMVQKSKL
jgi:hypothetical protein